MATSSARLTDRRCCVAGRSWTASDVIEHLVLLEGSLERFLAGRWSVDVKAGWLPLCTEAQVVDCDELTAEPCRELYAPRGLIAWATLWADAASIRQHLLLTLEDAYGLDWDCAVITRPGFGVRASLQQWLAWTAAYETSLAFALETGETDQQLRRIDGCDDGLRLSN